ncbi:MAG: bifunctional phosphoglucose/phosphomannose isomerase [Promethearchaeota archaeon]
MSLKRILDDPEGILQIDKDDMLGVIEKSPAFMKWCLDTFEFNEATRVESQVKEFIAGKQLKGIFVVGMGGSAISGDIASDWLLDIATFPVTVIRGYELPAYIDDNYLGFFLSYSGNTEETLSSFAGAVERKIPCIGITSGGMLEEFLEKSGGLVIKVPGGYQPRAAFLYLFTTLAIAIANSGLIHGGNLIDQLKETHSILELLSKKYSASVPIDENRLKQHAMNLFKSIVVIYGYKHLISVARRFKGQVNENGKNPAYYDFFSELNHNETVGWEISKDVAGRIACIFLHDGDAETTPIRTRIEYTENIIKTKASHVLHLNAVGKSRLAKMLSLVYMADFISTYLALLNGSDPTPVTYIQGLKDVLKEKVNLQGKIREKIEKLLSR